MGMFDYYRPAAQLLCPICRQPLVKWQGYDGPNGILVWVEGVSHPVDQDVSDDVRLEDVDREKLTLPVHCVIYSHDCSQHSPVEADCDAPEGVWTKTTSRPFRKIR